MSNLMSLSLSMPVLKRISTILAAGMLLAGCTTAELAIDLIKKNQKNKEEIATSQNGGVVAAPRYKIGDPYKVAGVWYYPERDLSYDETGIG